MLQLVLHYYQITMLPGHIIPNSIFLLHPVPHCAVLGLGRHAVCTLSRQASQLSSPVLYCAVLHNSMGARHRG